MAPRSWFRHPSQGGLWLATVERHRCCYCCCACWCCVASPAVDSVVGVAAGVSGSAAAATQYYYCRFHVCGRSNTYISFASATLAMQVGSSLCKCYITLIVADSIGKKCPVRSGIGYLTWCLHMKTSTLGVQAPASALTTVGSIPE